MLSTAPFSFVCPLSGKVVTKRAGITAAGSAYDYRAIKRWQLTSELDPVTKLRLHGALAFVRLEPFETKEDLEHAKAAVCALWKQELEDDIWALGQDVTLHGDISRAAAVLQARLVHNEAASQQWHSWSTYITETLGTAAWEYFPELNEAQWAAAVAMRAAALESMGLPGNLFAPKHLLAHVALDGATFRAHVYKCVKNISFAGAFLQGRWTNWLFDNNLMVGTNMRDAVFRECVFRGLNTCFTGAAVTHYLQFEDCKVQHVQETNDSEYCANPHHGLRTRNLTLAG